MLAQFTHRLRQAATIRNLLLLFLLFIAFNLLVLPPLLAHFEALSNGVGLVDLLDSYTPDQLYAHLANFDQAGRHFYILHELTLDVVYPLLSALLFGLAIAYHVKRALPATSPLQYLGLLPFVLMGVDYLENASLVIVLAAYPTRLEGVARVANLFTLGKWSLSNLILLILVVSVVGFWFQKAYNAFVSTRIQAAGRPQ